MNRISELRKKHGYSQAQLGKLLGVAQNTICNWEKGKREPDYLSLKKLAYHLDCSVEYLLGDLPIGRYFVFDNSESTKNPDYSLEHTSFHSFLSETENRSTDYGTVIEDLRYKKDLSRTQLSVMTDIDRDRLWKIESGQAKPTTLENIKLAKALGGSVDLLETLMDKIEIPVDSCLNTKENADFDTSSTILPNEFNQFNQFIETLGFNISPEHEHYQLHKDNRSVTLSIEELRSLMRASKATVSALIHATMDEKQED